MTWLFLLACHADGWPPGADGRHEGHEGHGEGRSVPSPDTASADPDPLKRLFGDRPVEVALTLDAAAIAGLARSAAESPPDVEGTFTFEGVEQPVGVRLKGGMGSFRTIDQKPSFTLDFEGFGGEPLHGLRRLHLNNLVQDRSMLGEHAAYELFAARDLAGPRHGYARVTVNGEPFGLYGVVDKVDVDVLRHHFGQEGGVLFEGEMDDLEDSLIDDFVVVRDGGLADPYATLYALLDELDAAPWNARGAVLEARFDRERLLDAFATELVSGNDDGYVTWNNNFFLWQDPESGRFTMLPWGPDQAFQEEVDPLDDWSARLWQDCRNDPACDAELRASLSAAADVLGDPHWRTKIEAIADRTQSDCLEDPRAEAVGDACVSAREDFFAFLDERPDQIRAALGGGP